MLLSSSKQPETVSIDLEIGGSSFQDKIYLTPGQSVEQIANEFCVQKRLSHSVQMAIIELLREKLTRVGHNSGMIKTNFYGDGQRGHPTTPLKTQDMLNTEISLHHMPGLIYSQQLSSRDPLKDGVYSQRQSASSSNYNSKKSKPNKENMSASSRYGYQKPNGTKESNSGISKKESGLVPDRKLQSSSPIHPFVYVDNEKHNLSASGVVQNPANQTAVFIPKSSGRRINQDQPSLKKAKKIFYVDQDLDLQELDSLAYVNSSYEFSGRGQEIADITPVKPLNVTRHAKPDAYFPGQILPNDVSKRSSDSVLLEMPPQHPGNHGIAEEAWDSRIKRQYLKEDRIGGDEYDSQRYRIETRSREPVSGYSSNLGRSARTSKPDDFKLFVNPHLVNDNLSLVRDLVHHQLKEDSGGSKQKLRNTLSQSQVGPLSSKSPLSNGRRSLNHRSGKVLPKSNTSLSRSSLSKSHLTNTLQTHLKPQTPAAGRQPTTSPRPKPQPSKASKSKVRLGLRTAGSSSAIGLSARQKSSARLHTARPHSPERVYDVSELGLSHEKHKHNWPLTRGFVAQDRQLDDERGIMAGNRLYTQAAEKELQLSAIRLQKQSIEENYYRSLDRIPKIDKVSKELAEARIFARTPDYRYEPEEVFERLSKAAKQSYWKRELKIRARSLECSRRDRYIPETNPISSEIVELHQERIGSETSRDPFVRLYTNNPEDFYRRHKPPEDWTQARSSRLPQGQSTTERTSRSKDSKPFLERMQEDLTKRLETQKAIDEQLKVKLDSELKKESKPASQSIGKLAPALNTSKSRISPAPADKQTRGSESLYEKGLAQLSRREALVQEAAALSRSLSSKSLTSRRSAQIVERIIHEHVLGIFKTLDTDRDGFVSFANVLQEFENGSAPVTKRFAELIAPFMKQIVEKKMTLDSLAFEYSLKKFIKKLNVADKRVLLCLDYEGKNAFMKMMAKHAQENLKKEGLSELDIKDNVEEPAVKPFQEAKAHQSPDKEENSPLKRINVADTAIALPKIGEQSAKDESEGAASSKQIKPAIQEPVLGEIALDAELAQFKRRMEALGMFQPQNNSGGGEESSVSLSAHQPKPLLNRSALSAGSYKSQSSFPKKVSMEQLKEMIAQSGSEANVQKLGPTDSSTYQRGQEIRRELVSLPEHKEEDTDSLALEGTEGFPATQANAKSLDGLVREVCEGSMNS